MQPANRGLSGCWRGLVLLLVLLASCGTAPGYDGEAEDSGNAEEEVGSSSQALCGRVPLRRVQAWASSAEGAQYYPAAAIDGDRSTRWSSVFAEPQDLIIALDQVRRINRVILRWEAATSSTLRMYVADSLGGPWIWTYTNENVTGGNQVIDDLWGAGRFLKLEFEKRKTPFGVSLFEVEIFGDPDPTCEAPTTPPAPACESYQLRPEWAFASSLESERYEPRYAVDGIVENVCGNANRWSSAARDPSWLVVQFDGPVHIDRVVLNWECAASASYELQISSHWEGPWATIHTDTAADGGRDEIRGLNATGQYLRIFSRARRTGFGNSLYEVEVFGDHSWACGSSACVNPGAANQTGLTLHQPGIGARMGGTTNSRSAVRIAQNPLSKKVYVMRDDGSLHELSLATLTTTPAVSASSILSQLPAGTFFTSVQGLAFGPEGNVYLVANEDHGSTNVGLVVRGVANATATAWTWSLLARSDEYPDSGTSFDHHWNGIVVTPDGNQLYVASGSRTDHGEVQDAGGAHPGLREAPLTAAIFRLTTGYGGIIRLPNAETNRGHIFAHGIRNMFDMAYAADGKLFGVDSGPDADYADELNWLQLFGHYGFPWRLGAEDNAMQFASYDPALDRRLRAGLAGTAYFYNDPAFTPRPSSLAFTDPVVNHGPDADLFRNPETGAIEDASASGKTLSTFTAHRSPLGLAFDVEGRLCGPLRRGGFVLSSGAAVAPTPTNGMFPDVGRDLLGLELPPTGQGVQLRTRKLVSGFASPTDSVLIGNKLYVLESGVASRVYELSFPVSD